MYDYHPDGESDSRPHTAEQLSGVIERVTFHSEESGFCVLQVKAKGHRDLLTVVGTLPQARAGEWIEAAGRWTVNQDYGQQFKAEILRTTAPATAEGIEKYLASGLVKGIGPAFAQRLVRRFGTDVLDVIESTPQRLFEVDGIGPIRYAKITAAWAEQKMVRTIMVFLHSHGVSTSRAFRIYKTYGNEAIEKVSQDPIASRAISRGSASRPRTRLPRASALASSQSCAPRQASNTSCRN